METEQSKGFETPNVSAIQLVAIWGAVLKTIVAFGVDVSAAQQQAMTELVGLLAVLVVADYGIRRSRAKYLVGNNDAPAEESHMVYEVSNN